MRCQLPQKGVTWSRSFVAPEWDVKQKVRGVRQKFCPPRSELITPLAGTSHCVTALMLGGFVASLMTLGAIPKTVEIAPGVRMPFVNLGGVHSHPSNYTAWLELGGTGLDTALMYGEPAGTAGAHRN